MTILNTIRPTTELEAVNIVLSAIGEAPLPTGTNLTTAIAADLNVEMAASILRETVRDVEAHGWRFNTTIGFPLSPAGTYAHTDIRGVVTSLNVFVPRAEHLSWSQTRCPENEGIDLIPAIAPDVVAGQTNVIFDRLANRPGVPAAKYPFIFLDVTLAIDFPLLPEEARRLITIMASRRMAQRVPASEAQAGFTQQDERQAMRVLQRTFGIRKPGLNLFNTAEAHNIAGGRPQFGGGIYRRVI